MHPLIVSMASMMNVKGGIISNYGKHSRIVSIVCQWQQLLMRKYFVVTEVRLREKFKKFYSLLCFLCFRLKSRSAVNGADQKDYETYRCARSRAVM